jgi:hypothetical protein
MSANTLPSTFDPAGLPIWAQEQARRALELLPEGVTILSAREAGNASVNLAIADESGALIGNLVVFPADITTHHSLRSADKLHIKQIAVKRGNDLVWVTLGKLLDPQLCGRSNGLIVRIRKTDGYEVTTVSRGTGRPVRYRFEEDEIAAVRLGLDG